MRRIWLYGLLVIFGTVYILCRLEESSKFGGIDITSMEELEDLTLGMQYIENPSGADDFLTCQGQQIAYDKESQIFYVSQPVREDELVSSFDSPVESIRLFIEEDEFVHDIEEAMRSGHVFRIWIVGEHRYTVCGIMLTGAPVLTINSSDRLKSDYQEGDVLLSDPQDEEINGFSTKSSNALLKYNANSGTYSVKLMKKDYTEKKKLSFLGIGKNNAWKLYKVSARDGSLLQAKLAADVWNIMNADTPFVREYEFVELIENNSYKGLYLMAPKWSRSMLDLAEQDSVIKSEDLALEEAVEIFTDISDKNLGRYYMFLQITYAYQNSTEDYAVIEKIYDGGEKEHILVPDKLEYAFGGFEKRLHYLTWEGGSNNISRMLIALQDITSVEERQEEEILRMCQEEWKQHRMTTLGNENLQKRLQEYESYLTDSGLAKRCVEDDTFGYYFEQLENYVMDRMDYMDAFFDSINGYE